MRTILFVLLTIIAMGTSPEIFASLSTSINFILLVLFMIAITGDWLDFYKKHLK